MKFLLGFLDILFVVIGTIITSLGLLYMCFNDEPEEMDVIARATGFFTIVFGFSFSTMLRVAIKGNDPTTAAVISGISLVIALPCFIYIKKSR